MAGRGLGVAAAGIALALAIGAAPAVAASPARSTTVVAGSALTTSISTTASGVERTATLPGVAALRFATTPDQARAAMREHLRSLGTSEEAADPAEGPALDGVFPVGDLDGDRRADVVLSQYANGATRYLALAGDSGKRLWTVDGTAAERWTRETEVVALDGEDAGGALLITATYEEIPSDVAWSLRISIDLTAVSGDGTARWSRSSVGLVALSEVGALVTNLSYPMGVGPLNGNGDDVLMRSDDTVYSLAGGGTSRLEVLDGDTGHPGAVIETASQDEAPASGLVGDLDGDGLLDIVTAASGGGQVLAIAHKGTDGRPLWQRSIERLPVYWVESAGRTDADQVGDVLLVGVDWNSEQFFSFTVVSGADGAPGMTASSDGLIPSGDISGDGLDDLLLLKAVATRNLLGVEYRAVTGAGKKLYSRTYALQMPKGSAIAFISIGPVGDVDGDGSDDLSHDINVIGFDQAAAAGEEGVVLTRNGRKIYEKMAGDPLHASFDRHGDDSVRVRRTASGAEVSAHDGRTKERLWQRSVPMRGYRPGLVFGADLTRDGRAELLLVGWRAAGAVVKVIDGRTAAVRWGR